MAQQTLHSPTLNTIRMVEETLKDAPETYTTIAELKRLLPKQVQHNTLKEVLKHLEENNRIIIRVEGILYIPPLTDKERENLWEWTPNGFRKYRPRTQKNK